MSGFKCVFVFCLLSFVFLEIVSSLYTHIQECKYGKFLINEFDSFIGKFIQRYGEWGEVEVGLFLAFIGTGDVVFDVGANQGAMSIPMARAGDF